SAELGILGRQHVMTARAQLRDDGGCDVRLDQDARAPVLDHAEARRVERGLDVHAEVHEGRDDLQVALRLPRPPPPPPRNGPPTAPTERRGPSPAATPEWNIIAGMMVWNGRFLGASAFGCAGSSEKPPPRFWSAMPVVPATSPLPNP